MHSPILTHTVDFAPLHKISQRLSVPISQAAPIAKPEHAVVPSSTRAARSTVIKYRHVLGTLALVGLIGCGSTGGERAVSGAGIGAGAGAVLGAVTGMGVGTGAAVGAAAGAAAGGLTSKKQINLGKPVWR